MNLSDIYIRTYIGILLDVLGGLDPVAQPDAVVYSSGAVKLLCSNSELRGQLVAGGVIKCISTLLKKLKEVRLGIHVVD